MLTHGILNADLASCFAQLRHKDRFVISDCGLPVPTGTHVVDLALTFGIPSFTSVLDAIADELVLEEATLAEEARGTKVQEWVTSRFNLPVQYVPHDGEDGFKALVEGTKFVIRTGETTPYANVIFRCGVPFS